MRCHRLGVYLNRLQECGKKAGFYDDSLLFIVRMKNSRLN